MSLFRWNRARAQKDNAVVGADDKDHHAGLRAMFNEYDKDGSGTIDLTELKPLLINLGFNMTDEEMEVIHSYPQPYNSTRWDLSYHPYI